MPPTISLSPSPSPSPSPPPAAAGAGCFDGRCVPAWFNLCLGVVLLAGGLVLAVAGYRFFRPTLLLLGALAAGLPVWVLVWDHAPAAFASISADGALGLGGGAGAFAGALSAALCWRFFRVGVFVIGAALGVLLALVLNLAVFVHLVPPAQADAPFIGGGVVLGGVFGALALRFMRPTMIAATAAIGAYACIRGVSLFAGGFPDELGLVTQLESGARLSVAVYGYLGGMGALALVGAAVQVRFTAPRVRAGEKDENEIAFDEAEDDFNTSKKKKKKVRARRGARATATALTPFPPSSPYLPQGKKGKRSAKKAARGKSSVRADALLRDYEAGGEFYEAGYDEGDNYADAGDAGEGGNYEYEGDASFLAEPAPAPAKKGGFFSGFRKPKKEAAPVEW